MTHPAAGLVLSAALAFGGAALGQAPAPAPSPEGRKETRHLPEQPGPLLALLRRLRKDPPPLRDAPAMQAWTAPYGNAAYENDAGCQRGTMHMQPPALPGIGMLSTTLRSGCATGARHSMLLLTMEAGSALEEPARALLTEMFGPRHEACSDDDRSVWTIAPEMYVALVSPFYPSFAIMVLDRPVTDLDCAW